MNKRTQFVVGESLAEAYNKALVALNDNGKIKPCNAYSSQGIEKVQKNVQLVMEVTDVDKEPCISKFFLCGPESLQEYELELVYGIRDFCVTVYEQGKNPNFWPYTYSQRINQDNQVDFVLDTLTADTESRRGVILIRDNDVDMKVDDPACLQELIFELEDNRLNMTAIMRSNDATQASGMNMYAFIKLQKEMVKKLKERDPEKFKDLKAGSYTHMATSYHAYGEVVSKAEYENFLLENEGITLDEDQTTIMYEEDRYVVGEIRRLQKNAERIKKGSLSELVYPYEPDETGYGWKIDMEKRIAPYLAETVIAEAVKYDMFDQDLVTKIDTVLEAYGVSEEELALTYDKLVKEEDYYSLKQKAVSNPTSSRVKQIGRMPGTK